MAPRLHGVDVSSNNTTSWRPAAGDAFAFVKATEGRSYTNPRHDAQVALVRSAGQVVGHYHWLHPGNVQAQAEYFVRGAKARPGDLLVCDWEEPGTSNADKDAFIRAVKKLAPQCKVGLYCNVSWWKTIDKTSYCGDFLWIAAPGRDTGPTTTPPPIKHPWMFWQYSFKPIDLNWAAHTVRATFLAWCRALIPPPPGKPRTVANAVVTLAAEVPVKAWGDVDFIQAFDVHGSTLAALQTQKVGKREDARVRWHRIVRVGGKLIVTYLRTDVLKGAGHPQTLNLNHRINVPWAGRKATFAGGRPRRNSKGSKALPVACWPKTGTAGRTATATTETYTYAHGKTSWRATVRKFGGTFQGATAWPGGFARVNGKTIDSGTKHKVTVTQFDPAGRTVGVKDLTYLLKALKVTSLEPEGISYCQLPGDTRPYLYVGVRTGSVAKRRYLILRLEF